MKRRDRKKCVLFFPLFAFWVFVTAVVYAVPPKWEPSKIPAASTTPAPMVQAVKWTSPKWLRALIAKTYACGKDGKSVVTCENGTCSADTCWTNEYCVGASVFGFATCVVPSSVKIEGCIDTASQDLTLTIGNKTVKQTALCPKESPVCMAGKCVTHCPTEWILKPDEISKSDNNSNGIYDSCEFPQMIGGENVSGEAVISGDGRFVAFSNSMCIYVYDRNTGQETLASVMKWEAKTACSASSPSISANGRYVAFSGFAAAFMPNSGGIEIIVRDMESGQNVAASAGKNGLLWYGDSEHSTYPVLSADGKFVAFTSASSVYQYHKDYINVVNFRRAYVHDLQSGKAEIVSVGSGMQEGLPYPATDENLSNSNSFAGGISGDGQFVVFSSPLKLVPSVKSGVSNIFVRDRNKLQTSLVSVGDGTGGNDDSYAPMMSVDGRFVSFWSRANNLVPGDTNGRQDVFLYDRETGKTERVSVNSDGLEGNADSAWFNVPSINADGRFIVFDSSASNLVPSDTNGLIDVFVHDRQTGKTEMVSVNMEGSQLDGLSSATGSAISADGRFIIFDSEAHNAISSKEYLNGNYHAFVTINPLFSNP